MLVTKDNIVAIKTPEDLREKQRKRIWGRHGLVTCRVCWELHTTAMHQHARRSSGCRSSSATDKDVGVAVESGDITNARHAR